MREVQTRTITVDGAELTLVVERKRVKHVNARLRGSTLSVSAPPATPEAALEPIVLDLARKLVRRERRQRVNDEEDALALGRKVAASFPQPPQVAEAFFVTTQQARWGSYSPATGTIRLHAALRQLPRWVLEAIVAHELAHAVHPDHSPAFWALLRRARPDIDRAEAFLAGVGWLARRWEGLPPVERALLAGGGEGDEPSDGA